MPSRLTAVFGQREARGQRSRFLVLTKRSAASVDENVRYGKCRHDMRSADLPITENVWE